MQHTASGHSRNRCRGRVCCCVSSGSLLVFGNFAWYGLRAHKKNGLDTRPPTELAICSMHHSQSSCAQAALSAIERSGREKLASTAAVCTENEMLSIASRHFRDLGWWRRHNNGFGVDPLSARMAKELGSGAARLSSSAALIAARGAPDITLPILSEFARSEYD